MENARRLLMFNAQTSSANSWGLLPTAPGTIKVMLSKRALCQDWQTPQAVCHNYLLGPVSLKANIWS